jgi:hypothetical protein
MRKKQTTFRAMRRRLLARASVLALRVAMGFGLVAATVVLPAGWVKAEPYVFDIVALLGDTAPDTGGDTFTDFPVSAPVLNAAGDVAFGAVFGAAHDDGIFKESSGKLIAVALRGDTAPGTGGDTFADFVYAPLLNVAGEVVFAGRFGAAKEIGIFKEGSGTLTAVALAGNIAPGTSDTFRTFGVPPVLNERGDTAFQGFFGGSAPSFDEGVFKKIGGTPTAVALPGDTAPDTGATFAFFVAPVLNGAGDTAFRGLFGAAAPFDHGIFKESGGTLTAVAIPGDIAPGPRGGTFTSFGTPVLNGAGDTAFLGFVGNDHGIFKEGGGTLTAVALTKDTALGTGGDTFTSFGDPVLNGAGDVAFQASFGGLTGIFKESGGTLTAVALPGDIAPGTGGDTFTLAGLPVLNGAGEVAFIGSLSGAAAEGVFTYDPLTGLVEKILAVGDMLEVAPNEVREVDRVFRLGNSGNQDGRRSAFNDDGQVALHVTFTDGSRAIVRVSPADTAIERLIALVEAAGLLAGIENSLVRKLESSLGFLARDNTTGAIAKLGDFIDQVEAQRGRQIAAADADAWIASAEAILDALGEA